MSFSKPNNTPCDKQIQMKKLTALAWLFVALVTTFFLACEKDNTETTNLVEDPIRTDTTRVNCNAQTVAIALQHDSAATVSALLTANRTGGTLPFSYSWSTGDSVQAIRVSFNGTYSVTVTDALGCAVSNAQVVVLLNACGNIRAQITQTSGTTQLVTNATNGTLPYTYRWSTGATTRSINYTNNGTYGVTVTDAIGCVATNQITVGSSADCSRFRATIIASDSTQFGVAWVNPTNGTAPYAFTWSTGATSNYIDVTTNGAYRVTVTDANGCAATDELNVSWSATCRTMALRFAIDTVGQASLLRAVPALGSTPYAYRWSTGAITNTVPVTFGNAYQVTVTDARGCSVSGKQQL
jgi:hypothetical protein